jgi:hypothetical protein
MSDPVRGRPVFVVGLPRTGTTITRAVLNVSPFVGIGGESLFLPDRSPLGTRTRDGFRETFRRIGDLNTDRGIARVADYVYSVIPGRYWWRLARTLDRDEFEARLRASDRSDRAVFDIAMTHFAAGRPIRGDKSAQHLHSVPLLMEWFPDAKVIHTFRDPRAVYLSTERKASARPRVATAQRLLRIVPPLTRAYSATSVIFNWRAAAALHRVYQAKYPENYMLVRYEDLVLEPEATARTLCSFIGVPFIDEMLDQVVLNSSFGPGGTSKGFDKTSIGRWRSHLSPLTKAWFLALCRRELTEFGYEL